MLCVLSVCCKHIINQAHFNPWEGAFTPTNASKELPGPELSALSGCWELMEEAPSRRDFCSFSSCHSSQLRMKLQVHIKMSDEQGWNILFQYFQLKQNAWSWPEICFLFLFSWHFPVEVSVELVGLDRPAWMGILFSHSVIVNLKCLFWSAIRGSYFLVCRSFHKHQAASKYLKADAQAWRIHVKQISTTTQPQPTTAVKRSCAFSKLQQKQ